MSLVKPHGWFLAALALTLAGCAKQAPLAPTEQAGESSAILTYDDGTGSPSNPLLPHGYYPLQLGNRWSFRGGLTVRSGPAGGPLDVIYDVPRTAVSELTCVESISGVEYMVERSTSSDGTNTYLDWVRYRQDQSGLYEADVATNVAPSCDEPAPPGASSRRAGSMLEAMGHLPGDVDPVVFQAAWREFEARLASVAMAPGRLMTSRTRPGGPLPDELTRLRYPMRPGQSWIIRADPEFSSRVEGVQLLRTPVGPILASRVRITSEFFSPEDRVVTFYSRHGFLGVHAHLVTRGTDSEGNEVVTIFDDVLNLVDLELAHGRF